uniref:Small, acid-soluble spore protein, alpha/beta type n=2 Tax=Bursaphelenchus xylophilus TaxID=6326 RepID=A0A1I7S8J4_BURXY
MFAFFSEFPKKDELGKTNKFKASPVQTEVDMEPSPPELVRGASVNQSKKL